MDVPTLTDGTTTIRALDDRDVAGVLEQCLDPLSIAWTEVPVPFGVQDAVEFVHEIAPGAWADGSQWIFCVEHPLADGTRYAGNIALRDEGHGRAEIAFGSHPAARGSGAMEAGLRLLLEWGFGTQGVRTVVWRANVGNWASRKLAWRLGFTIDGVLRHSQFSRGELVDAWVGTLLADEPREPSTRWLTSPVLDGAGVRLRPVGEDDVPRVVEACSDPRTQHWLGAMPAPYTPEHARGWIEASTEKQATGTGTTWAVADPADDRLLAAISIFDVSAAGAGDTDGGECEIGYWAHPDARGRGVVRAAVEAVTSWSFDALGLRRVRIVAAVDNAASCHVAEACGFRRTGEERLATRLRTGLADVALFDVMASEWSTRPHG